MHPKETNRMKQAKDYMASKAMLSDSSHCNDPVFQDLFLDAIASPLCDGAVSEASFGLMGNILGPSAIASQLGLTNSKSIPAFNPKEGVLFGHCVNTGAPVGVPYRSMNKHIALLGASGSGKTNADGPLILEQCPANVKYHFLDVKGEAGRLLNRYPDGLVAPPNQIFSNIFASCGDIRKTLMGRLQKLASILSIHSATWPEGVEALSRVFETRPKGAPPLDLASAICVAFELGKKVPKFKTLADRLQILANALGDEVSRVCEGPDIMKRYRWIGYDYSGMSTMECNALEMCRQDCLVQKLSAEGHSNSLSHIIVIDEVLNFFSKEVAGSKSGSGNVAYQRTALAQLRSYGICLVISCQFPDQADPAVLANADTAIIMKLPKTGHARVGSQLLCGTDELISQIQELQPGYAFFRSSLFSDYIKIKMPYIELGEYPGRDKLDRMMAPEIEWMRQNSVLSPRRVTSVPEMTYADIFPDRCPVEEAEDSIPHLLKEQCEFLYDVARNPILSTRERYKGLGLSAGVGQRIRNALLDQGLIEIESQPSKGGRPVKRLRITLKGEEYLDGLSESE